MQKASRPAARVAGAAAAMTVEGYASLWHMLGIHILQMPGLFCVASARLYKEIGRHCEQLEAGQNQRIYSESATLCDAAAL